MKYSMDFDEMINTVQLGDSSIILKKIPNNVIDLVVTSPPYEDLRKYNNSSVWNFDIFKEIAKQLVRILKKGGIIVWVAGDKTKNGSESGVSFKQVLYFMELGLNLHDTMIFEKNTSTFPARKNGSRYTQIFEYMFVLSKGKPKTANLICDKKNAWGGVTTWGNMWNRNNDDTLVKTDHKISIPMYSPRNNIWKYKVGKGLEKGKGGVKEHPAVFPLQLAKDHILSWTNKNDIVLDPFIGSGTTGIACKELGRNYIGIDIDKEYYNLAISRINNAVIEEKNDEI